MFLFLADDFMFVCCGSEMLVSILGVCVILAWRLLRKLIDKKKENNQGCEMQLVVVFFFTWWLSWVLFFFGQFYCASCWSFVFFYSARILFHHFVPLDMSDKEDAFFRQPLEEVLKDELAPDPHPEASPGASLVSTAAVGILDFSL